MGLKKRVFRCGCNNSSISLPSVNNGNRTCCQNCAGAPCFFSIMSDCDVWMPNGELLLQKNCTLLKKDCINGCTWSSRWNAGNGSATIDFPLEQFSLCQVNKCSPFGGLPNNYPCDFQCPHECFYLTITTAEGMAADRLSVCSGDCFDNDDPCTVSFWRQCNSSSPPCLSEPQLTCGTASASPYPPITIVLKDTGIPGGECRYFGDVSCCAQRFPVAIGTTYSAGITFSNGVSYLFFNFATLTSSSNTAVAFTAVKTLPDLACYSGTAGAGWPSSITSTYSFDIGPNDWDIVYNYYDTSSGDYGWSDGLGLKPRIAGTIDPSDVCYATGTSGGMGVSSGNIKISTPSSECWWQEDAVQGGACSIIDYLTGPCGNVPPDLDRGYTGTAGTAGISNFMKWVLTLNSQTGTADGSSLVLRTREGYAATYLSTIDSCKEPNTFTLSTYDSKLKFLPPKLCVIPVESTPPLVCETGTAQCNCCEDGDELFVSIVVSGCDALAGGYTGSLARISNAGSASLPCGVSYPSSAPCGIFTLGVGTPGGDDCNVGGTDWSEAVYLVFYCNGTDYSIDVYCYDNDANCWVYQGAATVTNYECKCFGPAFAFTLPALDCCCPEPCESCTPPSTLYADLSSECFGWSGTVTLTETAGVWQGSTGAPIQVVDVQLRCIDGDWTLTIEAVNASCGLDNAIAESWACDPSYTASFTLPLSSDCCPPSGGTLTVEVYE